MLAAAIESGRLIDLILLLVIIEAIVLTAWRRSAGRPPSASHLLVNLAAGAMLLLAVRAALTDAGWISVAAWLALALPAHLADIALRIHGDRNRG